MQPKPFPESQITETGENLSRGVPFSAACYGYGGKGFDFLNKSYVDHSAIFAQYNYYKTQCINNPPKPSLVADKGVDCAGLVMWSYNTAFGPTSDFGDNGNPIRYQTANSQYLHNTSDVSETDLKAGDLLFFNYEHGIDLQTGLPKFSVRDRVSGTINLLVRPALPSLDALIPFLAVLVNKAG